jgi:hypothetical protein
MGTEYYSKTVVMYILVRFCAIKYLGMVEWSSLLMDMHTKVTGSMDFFMAVVEKYGLMEKSMKENMHLGVSMDEGFIDTLPLTVMRVSSTRG